MATADKLNYLLDTKEKIKTSINYDFEKVLSDTFFREYADKIKEIIDDYKTYIPTETLTGSSFQISNAAPLNAKKGIIYGNSHQETTTGKNLLDSSAIRIGTKNGLTASYDKLTQIITINGECNADNTNFTFDGFNIPFASEVTTMSAHYVSGGATGPVNWRTYAPNYLDGEMINLGSLNSTTKIISLTTTKTVNKTMCNIRVDSGTVVDNLKFKLMIADTTNTTYEPYTNGLSPNPNFSQNAEVLDGTNLFAGYKNMIGGFLPYSGEYPTTNEDYPNAKYQLINLRQGESIAINGPNTSLGRIRVISKETNKVLGNINTSINDTYESTADYTSGIQKSIITAKQDFILGIMLLQSPTNLEIMITKGVKYEDYVPFNNLLIKNSGKNLLNHNNIMTVNAGLSNVINEDGTITTTGIPIRDYVKVLQVLDITDTLKDGTKYTMSQEPNKYLFVQLNIKKYDGTYSYISATEGEYTFTVNKELYKTYELTVQTATMSIWGEENRTITNYYQLEESSTATPYDPYRETDTYSVDLKGNFAGEIGNTTDDFNLTTGILTKKVGKISFDSFENFSINAKKETYIQFLSPVIDDCKLNYTGQLHSNYINGFGGTSATGKIRFNIEHKFLGTTIDTPDDEVKNKFMELFNGKNLEFIYPLENSYEVQLEPVNIKMHEGTNKIELVSNLETKMQLEYYKDYRADNIVQQNEIIE